MWNKTTQSRFHALKNESVEKFKILWEEDAWYLRTIPSFVYQQWVRFERAVIPIRRQVFSLSIASFVLVVSLYILFPTVVNADPLFEQIQLDDVTVGLIIESMQNETQEYGQLPVAEDALPRTLYTIPITAYTSDVAQTDDTPCITASGLDVCQRNEENVVATNFLPMGTRVRIPELFGDKVFYVEDRMNARYYYKMDVWMKEFEEAKQFGVKYATIEVF